MAITIDRIEFEVFGRVQGVNFRYYCEKKAHSLGIRGWVMNTSKGTVKGAAEGRREAVDKMKKWLESEGSPFSSIDYLRVMKEERDVDPVFRSFTVEESE